MSAAFFKSENLLVKSERSQFYGKEKCKKYEGLWQSRVHAVMERKHERGREYGKDYYERII